jgi:ubiquinone/menaquinone biosynthesis C-methylase UbiE
MTQEREYLGDLLREGAYWDAFIADRIINHQEIPGSVDFRLFFTQYSKKHNWGPPCLGPIAINFREREIRYVITTALRKPGARVLDLGCGSGWLSLELARQGAQVTGIDVAESNLALARYMAQNNERHFPYLYQGFAGLPCRLSDFGSVEYVRSDLNYLSLPSNEFDAVVVWDSLHHVENLDGLLEEVRKCLKPDGVFVGVDHAFATQQTHDYNGLVVALLRSLLRRLWDEYPLSLYEQANALTKQFDWGVLGVDYGVKAIDSFERLEDGVMRDMLTIIRREDAGKEEDRSSADSAPGTGHRAPTHTSPFEDISAERLIGTLLESFTSVRFATICPLVMPEQYFYPARCESERVFLHYLSASLVLLNEDAIQTGAADGQWFLFHLTPERPTRLELASNPELSRIANNKSAEALSRIAQEGEEARIRELQANAERIQTLEVSLGDANAQLIGQHNYINSLTSELERKNAALADLETYARSLEASLKQRSRRLPWQRK